MYNDMPDEVKAAYKVIMKYDAGMYEVHIHSRRLAIDWVKNNPDKAPKTILEWGHLLATARNHVRKGVVETNDYHEVILWANENPLVY